jgi:hypothetical protein
MIADTEDTPAGRRVGGRSWSKGHSDLNTWSNLQEAAQDHGTDREKARVS